MHDLRARPSARAAWNSSRDKSLQLSGVEIWMNLRGVWSTAGSPGPSHLVDEGKQPILRLFLYLRVLPTILSLISIVLGVIQHMDEDVPSKNNTHP